jgi:SAM-dependent methyltransferase
LSEGRVTRGDTVPKREDAMMAPIANVEMAAAWDGDEGDDWASRWTRYDRSIRRYQERLVAAARFTAGDRVLHIGCGNGQSTRAAARVAVAGSALGVDLSTRMIGRARELAAAEGLVKVAFERADAQVHPFEPDAYDAVISGFGAMFFENRLAALRNICGATRPGGRVVMLAWQELNRNEWLLEIRAALAAAATCPPHHPAFRGLSGSRIVEVWSATCEQQALGMSRSKVWRSPTGWAGMPKMRVGSSAT